MIRKVIPGKHADVEPDILIPYSVASEKNNLGHSSITVIAVRPETNKVDYEATIINSAAPYAKVVYLANLSGILVNDRAIVASHYSSQLQFAVNGKEEMAKYPEMIVAFEKKFKTDFRHAPIIGAYSAILDYKLSSDGEELFATMVPDSDFLEVYGQTIKKISGFYVLNYDIPAVITRHHAGTNIFIMGLQLLNQDTGFSKLHHLIYDNICRNRSTEIQGPETRKNLPLEWYNRVRRTYHMSRSHIEAMFDLTDFVFKDEKERIGFAETPLGRRLLQEKVMSESQLEERLALLKDNPLVYLRQPGEPAKLVDIILEGKEHKGNEFMEYDLLQCCKIIERIDWERLKQMSMD